MMSPDEPKPLPQDQDAEPGEGGIARFLQGNGGHWIFQTVAQRNLAPLDRESEMAVKEQAVMNIFRLQESPGGNGVAESVVRAFGQYARYSQAVPPSAGPGGVNVVDRGAYALCLVLSKPDQAAIFVDEGSISRLRILASSLEDACTEAVRLANPPAPPIHGLAGTHRIARGSWRPDYLIESSRVILKHAEKMMTAAQGIDQGIFLKAFNFLEPPGGRADGRDPRRAAWQTHNSLPPHGQTPPHPHR